MVKIVVLNSLTEFANQKPNYLPLFLSWQSPLIAYFVIKNLKTSLLTCIVEDNEKQMWFEQNILKVRPKISKQGRIIWRVVFWFLIIFVFCCYISSKNISS